MVEVTDTNSIRRQVSSPPFAESDVTGLVSDLAAKETPAGAQGKVDAHKDLTTGCHGNLLHSNALDHSNAADHSHSNKSTLDTYAQTEANLSDAVSKKHSNSLDHSNSNDPSAGEKAALAGTSGTPGSGNKFVTNADSRNSDARTPTTHSHAPGDVTGTAVITSDSRLSDARTPLAHNQDAATINAGTLDGDRLPAMSTTKKGAVPLTGTPSGKYLKDDGTWASPSSGSAVERDFGIIAGFLAANLTTTLALTNGTTFACYLGRAGAAFTSVNIRLRITTAAVTVTWAEAAVFKGPVVLGAAASLSRVGYANIASLVTSTGQKTFTVTITGVAAGDDLWIAIGCQATTAMIVRAGLADDIQDGSYQTDATRPSLMTVPKTFTIAGATTAKPWWSGKGA